MCKWWHGIIDQHILISKVHMATVNMYPIIGHLEVLSKSRWELGHKLQAVCLVFKLVVIKSETLDIYQQMEEYSSWDWFALLTGMLKICWRLKLHLNDSRRELLFALFVVNLVCLIFAKRALFLVTNTDSRLTYSAQSIHNWWRASSAHDQPTYDESC